MKRSDSFVIPRSQLKTGIRKALTNCLEMAGYAKDLLESGGNPVLALGLYSFAIEEYGKAELFKDCMAEDMKIYKVSKSVFAGKNSHFKRFQKAFDALPPESIPFGLEAESVGTWPKTKETKTEVTNQNSKIPSAYTDTLVDLHGRLSCFHLEWNEKNEKWESPPKVKPHKLLESIYEFEKYISQKLDSEYLS